MCYSSVRNYKCTAGLWKVELFYMIVCLVKSLLLHQNVKCFVSYHEKWILFKNLKKTMILNWRLSMPWSQVFIPKLKDKNLVCLMIKQDAICVVWVYDQQTSHGGDKYKNPWIRT